MQDQYAYQAGHERSAGFGESPTSVVHWALPTGRSWQSIASGYLGLLALVVWPLGPVVLALGIWALRRASREGSHGRIRAIFGVVVGVIATLLCGVLVFSALTS
jgi:hypothetical protein